MAKLAMRSCLALAAAVVVSGLVLLMLSDLTAPSDRLVEDQRADTLMARLKVVEARMASLEKAARLPAATPNDDSPAVLADGEPDGETEEDAAAAAVAAAGEGDYDLVRALDMPKTAEDGTLRKGLDQWYGQIARALPSGIAFWLKCTWSTEMCAGRNVIIDVGANVGAFSAAILSECPDCHVHAFEAIPAYARYAAQRLAADEARVTVWPFGLGDADATLSLWMDTSNLGWNTLVGQKSNANMKEIPARVMPFDNFVERRRAAGFDPAHIRAIKIDTEGAEWRVIRGMHRTLAALCPRVPLLVEVAWGPAGHPEWAEETIEFEWLFENGYKRVDLSMLKSTTDVMFVPDPAYKC